MLLNWLLAGMEPMHKSQVVFKQHMGFSGDSITGCTESCLVSTKYNVKVDGNWLVDSEGSTKVFFTKDEAIRAVFHIHGIDLEMKYE